MGSLGQSPLRWGQAEIFFAPAVMDQVTQEET